VILGWKSSASSEPVITGLCVRIRTSECETEQASSDTYKADGYNSREISQPTHQQHWQQTCESPQ